MLHDASQQRRLDAVGKGNGRGKGDMKGYNCGQPGHYAHECSGQKEERGGEVTELCGLKCKDGTNGKGQGGKGLQRKFFTCDKQCHTARECEGTGGGGKNNFRGKGKGSAYSVHSHEGESSGAISLRQCALA